jgi:SAM-dependent methyltransferase
MTFGIVPRQDAKCPRCGALERHRLAWLFLQKNTDLFDGRSKKMLHVAPEPCYVPKFKNLMGNNYLSADLFDPRAMVKMDICDIQYPDSTFDIILCNHVLEHVLDDRKAMQEFHRVLKVGGWAILNVPLSSETTFEDPTIVDPKERLRVFGQEDHVRRYGGDYVDRLRDSGFAVQIFQVEDLVDRDSAMTMGLTGAGEVFYCSK